MKNGFFVNLKKNHALFFDKLAHHFVADLLEYTTFGRRGIAISLASVCPSTKNFVVDLFLRTNYDINFIFKHELGGTNGFTILKKNS